MLHDRCGQRVSISLPTSGQPIYSNINAPERIIAPGLIMSWSAYLGAVPCVASNTP